jgi:hypothetical protein
MKLLDLLYERKPLIDMPSLRPLVLQNKALELAAQKNYLPLTPKISKILYSDIRVRAFHMTRPEFLPRLINIQGQKKSVSTSTKISSNAADALCGPLSCGVGVYLEGTVMFNAWRDLASSPDGAGRRWVSLEKLNKDFNTKYWFNVAYSDELSDIRDAINDIMWKEPGSVQKRKKLEALYIKTYIDLSEKFISDPARIKEILKISLTADPSIKVFSANNEIILNQIEVIDVIVSKNYIDPPFERIIPKVKSNIKGEFIISDVDDTNGRKEFFSKRKATIT